MRRFAVVLIIATSFATLFADADSFYKKWKNGDGKNNPGYVINFKLPEETWISRVGYFDVEDEDKATDKYPCVNTLEGSTEGAIVLMAANGEGDEFPAGADMSVSTDEAMGYGMILAVLNDDYDLFNKFARVVEYYEAKNSKYNYLTSWCIPAESDGDYPGYTSIKATVDKKIEEGWEYDDGLPYKNWYITKKPKMDGNAIVGHKFIRKDTGDLKPTVSGIAMDGSLDIAFAFLMAHDKWNLGKKKKGDFSYLVTAGRRYQQLMAVIKENADNEFLPTGDFKYDNGNAKVTRPCDWLLTHLRSYYELSQSEEARKLIGKIQAQMDDFSDEDTNNFTTDPTNTGLVPDFAELKNGQMDSVFSNVIHESNPDLFAVNAARYPMRQALDFLMYGDRYSLDRALDLVDFIDSCPIDFTSVDPSKHKDPFAAVRNLDGTVVSNYTNQVLKATVMATIHIAKKAGISEYDSLYNKYMGSTPPDKMKFDDFISQYSTWQDGQKFTRTNGNQKEEDTFEFKKDPGHSGYFEDTWTALALYTLEDKWERPHGYENEFDDADWDVASDSKDYLTLTEKDNTITVEVIKNPGDKKVSIIADAFECRVDSGYSLMMAIERNNGNGSSELKGIFSFPEEDYKPRESSRNIIIEEDNIARSQMAGFTAVTSKYEGSRDKKAKVQLILNETKTGLKVGTKFIFTKYGLYDPDVHPARYRYVDQWSANEPYYIKGDYVRHNFETYECIEDHTTTRSTIPGQNFEVWKVSDYTLIGTKWESNSFYYDGELVTYQGRTYMAKSSFLSIYPPPEIPTNWMLYYDPYANLPTNWFNEGRYIKGDFVEYQGNYYKCLVNHTANSGWTPAAAFTLWENVNGEFNNVNPTTEWETWTYYATGDVVTHNNREFECLVGHTSQPGWEPVNVPSVWLEK